MENYLSLRNPKSISIVIFVVLFLGYFLGIRFDNVYINKIIGLILYLFPIYFLVLVWREEFKKKSIKIILSILLLVLSIGSLLAFSFNLLTLASIRNGVDPSFEKIRSLSSGSSEVVTYRTNAGAMTSFGVVVRAEKVILPGVYIKHDLLDVDGADNVNISLVSPDSIKIDSINFSSPDYRSEYMSNNPKITEGVIIKI